MIERVTATPLRKLALLSKSDTRGGGASRVAAQLHGLLSNEGRYEVDHWIGRAGARPPQKSLRGGFLGDLAYRGSRLFSRWVGLPDFLSTEWASHVIHRHHGYDIYHAHDISDAISPYTLRALATDAALVWTFHDCSPFTGGCIYPLDCEAFVGSSCGNCPQLDRWPLRTRIDRTGYMQKYKISLINNSVAAAVCPSAWIGRQAAKAGVREDLIRIIPNAVDTGTFAPRDKAALRAELGLPQHEQIVLLLTMDFENPYKGTALAREALARLDRPVHVLLVGHHSKGADWPDKHYYHRCERTFDSDRLATYYAASDILLFPSVAENCSLALLESMASGTPAVAFDTGGNPELIRHQGNGWLAAPADAAALAHHVETALSSPSHLRSAAEWARSDVARCHSQEMFTARHSELYDSILAGRTSS